MFGGGVRRRVQFPDFQALLMNYDMFLIVEIKLDKYDIINIENCNFLNKPRTPKVCYKIWEEMGHLQAS